MIIILIIIRLKFSSFFKHHFYGYHEVGLKKQKKSGCIVCIIQYQNMHHQWTWRESFLLLTNSVSQQWVPLYQNYIIFFTFSLHIFHDAVIVLSASRYISSTSPWHGKKTWGAQWFVQSSQGCQSNGFDGSPFHTSPWCTTPTKRFLISDGVTHLYRILFSTESICFAGRILVTEGFYAFRVTPTNKSPAI